MAKYQEDLEQIREQYEVEKQLAARLRSSTRQERACLYTVLYDELFRRVPSHTVLTKRAMPQVRPDEVAYEMEILHKFLSRDACFLEVGAGDCALSLEVAKLVKRVYAVDVSRELTKDVVAPSNFQLIISDGCSIPVPAKSVDVAFSNQLMEHLHPDDALEQLRNIYAALAPGGIYLCDTPNRLRGPHDVSMYFDRVATGFHLKEYTVTELASLFRTAGFSTVRTYSRIMGTRMLIPTFPAKLCEMSIRGLPYKMRKAVASLYLVAPLLGIKLVGIKRIGSEE
jgi:SAM-dependent methyltransferase